MEYAISKNYFRVHGLQFIINALIILWIYTAGSKLMDLADFKRQLLLQPFGLSINSALLIFLPATEILTGLLLAIKKTTNIGLWLSAILLSAFTAYVVLVLAGYFTKIPCSCGGVLAFLSWKNHLLFNIVFLIINLFALYKTTIKKGGNGI